jgi:hypothetical protein
MNNSKAHILIGLAAGSDVALGACLGNWEKSCLSVSMLLENEMGRISSYQQQLEFEGS